ncbi:C2 domain [Dillenia turbinata]|uniref:C2 domain n=1 Tax=Dillenia turbinata TaxID=194707 RepID=A0AAN8USN9_9MAGN
MAAAAALLEITVISAEDLRLNEKNPVKKNAYVTVKTTETNLKTTSMDGKRGGYPVWNEKLLIDMASHVKYVTLEVQCKNSMGNRKKIGSALVPVSDFMGGFWPENYLHFLSYRLRDDDGERNGIINISVRVKQATGMVAPHRRQQSWAAVGVPAVAKGNWETLTGVPVWYGQ